MNIKPKSIPSSSAFLSDLCAFAVNPLPPKYHEFHHTYSSGHGRS